ncbi:hypothetical protein [Streptomyces sp. NPDC005322]|uniref:hypothetical protein n=1 Tax=unclassified Streptomyces TaxID=2593676 RepID=UPI0033B03139
MNHTTDKPGPGDPGRRDGHEPDGLEPGGVTPLHIELDDAESGSVDEEALRRLLHGAVDELEPSPNSLEHLRRAVPVRRTRRRQALIGAVAAVVLGGAAIPALVHVATTGDGADAHPANAASSHRPPETGGGQRGEGSGGGDANGPADKVDPDKGDRKHGKKKDRPTKGPKGDPAGTVPDPSSTLNATSPTCSRSQLSSGGAGSAGAADAEGRIYGSFRVSNISSQACTVEGSGSVTGSAQGGADSSRIFVVDHTAGDAATGLPDPSTQPDTLILQPGQAYEIKFAWIPASGGGTSGCSTTGDGGTPSPDPTPDAAQAPQDSSTSDPGGTPGGGDGGGGGEPPAASVLVSHAPEAGDPAAASVTLGGGCAGTIYRTGLLPAS